MQNGRIFARYDPSLHSPSLSQLALDLLEQQTRTWPQLGENYRARESARVRELQGDGFLVRLQYNPQRMISSGAKVDAQSIQARPCFLCLENLPELQQGISYRDDFLVLCNPAPIFAQHYTIAHAQHRPQALAEPIASLLQLAKDFSPHFTVFYNGPQCGASAPDHLHFQACPAGAIPAETQIHETTHRLLVKTVLGVAVHKIQKLGRKMLLLAGFEEDAMALALLRTFAAMKEAMGGTDEPMMNLICSFRDDLFQVLIFPRRKHRPDAYFREGEERVFISPASVDMGGLIITPIEKDCLQVDAPLVASIFREVSITSETLRRIFSLL